MGKLQKNVIMAVFALGISTAFVLIAMPESRSGLWSLFITILTTRETLIILVFVVIGTIGAVYIDNRFD